MNDLGVFEELYSKLNDEQRTAVDTLEGPVFVIAGPGTGKTQVLTLRIANILRKTDTPPDGILALTFTEAAATEMRQRLARIVGTAAYKVRIHTFHGFAESLIARYPDQFPRIIGSQIASDTERAEILDRALLETPVQHLRPYGDPLFYHGAVARAISTMKRENVTLANLEERVGDALRDFDALEGKIHEKGKYIGKMKGEFQTLQKRIERTVDLLEVYRAYEDGLVSAHRYDFDDLILEVVSALSEDENFRLQVQESVLYVLADEHQDANRAQNALLEHVASFHERPNLFVVGDEKQAIYRFQGADLDNVHHFRTRFDDTTILTLVENYRSTQPILNSALSLITTSPDERLSRVPLVAQGSDTGRPISIAVCSTAEGEMQELARALRTCIENGVHAGDIAVLVRRNRDVAYVRDALTREGIACTGAGESDALHNRFVEALIRILRAVTEPRDENIVPILTLPGFGLSPGDLWRVTSAARKNKISVVTLLNDLSLLEEAGVQDIETARGVAGTITTLVRLAALERPAVVAEEAIRVSGILPRLLSAADRSESLASVRALLRTFEDLSRREHGAQLPRALELLSLMDVRGIRLPGRAVEDDTRVKVMTVHASKGREFAQVFIPLATERAWSTRSRAEYFHLPDILSGSAELEDERRLLYVAITRAKQHATISYALRTSDGKSDAPSALLTDLDPALVESYDVSSEPVDTLTLPGAVRTDLATISDDDRLTLRNAFFTQGLSPTALNNYLECPWKYLYVNLLRIPEAENKFMLYGTAIHDALRRFADGKNRGEDIGISGLHDAFVRILSRSPLTDRELAELAEKGKESLTTWWEERHADWYKEARAEQRIEAYVAVGDEKLLIRGALDLLVTTQNGALVIDYKTGKPKSRNELMGLTKSGDGNYYRQLAFYALLLRRSEAIPPYPRMHEGVIEFVEPNDAGQIRRESFEIEDAQVDELEALIQKTAQEILSLSFWNTPCEEAECSWCRLRFGIVD